MATAGVRVKGLREVQRAFRRLQTEIGPELRDRLREAAEPVAREARDRLSIYPGASVGTIGPRVVDAGAFVTQRKGKVSGLRPDFGELQMREVMIPALEEHAEDIEQAGLEALDYITRTYY